MDNPIKLKDFFSIISNAWYLIVAGGFTLVIRAILSCFKAWALNNGERDDLSSKSTNPKFAGTGFKKLFVMSFLSKGKDWRIDDYWLPVIIGYSELIIFPILMAKGWFVVIGAWMVIKTASTWAAWQKTRTAYNRFLLGNIFSLGASYGIYSIFKLWQLYP
jgi:hypothetical protein